MAEWNEIMEGKLFITDLGADREVQLEGKDITLGRYAVWAPIQNCDRHQIVEVGRDLAALQQKYQVPDERVCKLG